jgi:hypothetical protein
MIDLGPVHRGCAQDVVDADIESIRFETFDFARDTVAILHDDDVALAARKQWGGKKQSAPQ